MGTDNQFIPYAKMLALPEEDFKNMLVARIEKPYITQLLQEMIDHEEETHSFAKTAPKRELTAGEKGVLKIFSSDPTRLGVALSEKVKEYTDINIIQEAIFAKAASDRFGLGTK